MPGTRYHKLNDAKHSSVKQKNGRGKHGLTRISGLYVLVIQLYRCCSTVGMRALTTRLLVYCGCAAAGASHMLLLLLHFFTDLLVRTEL